MIKILMEVIIMILIIMIIIKQKFREIKIIIKLNADSAAEWRIQVSNPEDGKILLKKKVGKQKLTDGPMGDGPMDLQMRSKL